MASEALEYDLGCLKWVLWDFRKLAYKIYKSQSKASQNPREDKNMNSVNHPTHYQGKYECIEVMKDILTEEQFKGFCLGNAFKYIWRAGKKNDFDEDIRKANWYLRYLLDD